MNSAFEKTWYNLTHWSQNQENRLPRKDEISTFRCTLKKKIKDNHELTHLIRNKYPRKDADRNK